MEDVEAGCDEDLTKYIYIYIKLKYIHVLCLYM